MEKTKETVNETEVIGAIEVKASSKGIDKLKRKKSEHTTLMSFGKAVKGIIELDLVSDESKQLLIEIQDESVQRFINKNYYNVGKLLND